jgi:hypothetical protein
MTEDTSSDSVDGDVGHIISGSNDSLGLLYVPPLSFENL